MKLTLADSKYLKESVSIISDLVTEGTFKVTPDNIELIAMDPANVAMVIFKLMGSTFTEYDVKKPELLGINLNNLKQILRRAKSNDIISLELDDNKLKITLKGTSTRTFHMPLIDVEEKEQKVPDLKFSVTITTDSSIINEAIEDADIVGESVSFIADPKHFVVSATGDLNKANIDIVGGDGTKITATEKVKAKYSLEYLKKIMQGSKLSDKVTLEFAKDYPLRVEYIEKNKVQLAFILAPRVDND
ncbi:MAG: proliferating cell nuclear antigen (pcna) [Nanoarchaeota archaeon]|nr:proliferating cell nuclear antigen (pcna) [Nanoarchaeota archaeon]MBU1321414.1 proliferating cell nuclear antigen (pcna) [Nanoarchaeota archaeon]MBU1597040.1 proliferating cell nuclear antigen (pcna) [Nanoarchaeota archaeon]MBU2440830.1 proliferating cell nuclear antigen (pcna) [Nanoarchaeota archaeon]